MSGERPDLVGRERHLRELKLLVEGATANRGNLLVLSGEAGAGKTRLAEEAVRLATDAGIAVAWATCWSDDAAPLSAWSDLLAAVDEQATPTSSPQGSAVEANPEAARALLIRSLVSQMRKTTSGRPTLLVVDDLQWCDPLSLRAVEALSVSLQTSPIALLATFRGDGHAAAGPFEQITRRGRHLIVPPLTDSELAELAVEVTGRQLSPPAIARLRDRTAGNVLFARELLSNLDPGTPDGGAMFAQGGSRSAAMFAGRLANLSSACQAMLLTASVIGRRFRLDVLNETLGSDPASALTLVDEARRAGLVRESGIGAYEFAHPLMAEACYAAAGLPYQVRLHRDVGEALERMNDRGLNVPAAEVAHHYASAAAGGVPAKAVHYATAAGHESMASLAYEDAAKDFARAIAALDLCPADDESRADLHLDLGDAHAASGELPAARSAYESAARLARLHRWPERLARAALGVGSGPGGFEVPPFDREQISLLEEAADVTLGDALRARILARLSVALSLDARPQRRGDLSQEAISLARKAGDAAALGYALASWCDVFAGPADVELRLDAAAEILTCAVEVGDTRLELLGRRLRVVALLEGGGTSQVDSEISAFTATAERLGQVVYSWYVPLWRAMRAVMDGRMELADRLRRDATRMGDAAHSANAAMLTGSQRAMLLCEIRTPADAVAFFEDLALRWPEYTIMVNPGLAYAYAGSGMTNRAMEILSTIRLDEYQIDTLGSEWLPSIVMLSYAVSLTDSDSLADDLYSMLFPFRGIHSVDGIGAYLMGSVERPLGMLAAVRGDRRIAEEHFEAALAEHRRIGARLLVAGTLRDAGKALGDSSMVDESSALYADLGIRVEPYEDSPIDKPTPAARRDPGAGAGAGNVFRRDGDVWLVGINGASTRVRHTKGMQDLAQLLALPGAEVNALDLVADGPTVNSAAPGDPIDTQARNQYRARLLEIEADLTDADDDSDIARSERLNVEREALIAELTAAYGLGGRARKRGNSAERARSAVTQRISGAITRIEAVAPDLGRHLRHSIRTGTFCSYMPERPTDWEL